MASNAKQTGDENALLNLQQLQKQLRGVYSTKAKSKVANDSDSRSQWLSNLVELTKESDNGGNLGIPLEGPMVDSNTAYVRISQENEGITQNGGPQAINPEVITTGNSRLSLAFFQQQVMLNQQLIAQQQQTRISLFTRVDSLAKAIKNNRPWVENESRDVTPPTHAVPVRQKRKTHELSDMEDVSSESESYSTDSTEEDLEVVEQEKKNESEQVTNGKKKGEKC